MQQQQQQEYAMSMVESKTSRVLATTERFQTSPLRDSRYRRSAQRSGTDRRVWLIDWVRFNVPPTHYRSYEGGSDRRGSGVTREEGRETSPGDIIQGLTPEWNIKNYGWIYKEQWTNEVGQLKKSSLCRRRWLKGRQFFFSGKIAVTPSDAAPDDTNPSDATATGARRFNIVSSWLDDVRLNTEDVVRRWSKNFV